VDWRAVDVRIGFWADGRILFAVWFGIGAWGSVMGFVLFAEFLEQFVEICVSVVGFDVVHAVNVVGCWEVVEFVHWEFVVEVTVN